MAETLSESKICPNCGTEIRKNAQFCYHCGGSVAVQPNSIEEKPLIKENLSEEKNVTTKLDAKTVTVTDTPIPKPPVIEKPNSPIAEEPKLKSAAAMRRKPKAIQPKQTEIIWEEYEGKTNGWFILVAILLTLFAAGILYVALQLK